MKYRGKIYSKTIWKVCKSNHEAILETIKGREDLNDSLDQMQLQNYVINNV